MRRMGWRDGQGVGPRVTLQQRRAQAADLGIKLDEEGQDTEEAEKHYYAPMDRPLASLEEVGIATDRGWGLGYKAGPSIPVSARREAAGPAYASYDDEGEDDVYSGSSSFPSKSGSKKDWAVVDLDEDEELHRVSRTGGRAPRKVSSNLAPRRHHPDVHIADRSSEYQGRVPRRDTRAHWFHRPARSRNWDCDVSSHPLHLSPLLKYFVALRSLQRHLATGSLSPSVSGLTLAVLKTKARESSSTPMRFVSLPCISHEHH